MTFGAFISTRRKEAKLNLRDTAKHLGISNGYLCDIEQGRRPAPEGAFVERISSFLELDKQEHEMLLDLAADSRQTVPADLPDYIRQHDIVRAALRVAKEERLCVDRLLGRLRFTCAHELGHWVLHQKLYSGTGDVAAYEGKTSLDESHGLVEWQADALATALLMPLPQIKRSFYRLRAGRSNEQLVAEMAQIFQVSKQAMRIRLETRNLI